MGLPAGELNGQTDAPPDAPLDTQLSSYDYLLPEELIAQRPWEPRHGARMLAVGPGEGAQHQTVWQLQEQLRAGDLLVVNNTRVLRARLRAQRPSGGAVELLVLEPLGEGRWLCLAKPAKRLRAGDGLELMADGEPPWRCRCWAVMPPRGAEFCNFRRRPLGPLKWSLCCCATALCRCRPISTATTPATTSAIKPATPLSLERWLPQRRGCTSVMNC